MKRTLLLIAAALSLVWVGAPATADANEAVTGGMAFEGPADLSTGTWSGTFTGQLSGSYQGIPWTVAFINPATAALSTVDVLGCTAGTVTGRFHVKTDDYGQVLGEWGDRLVFPTYLVAVDATFDFVWHRASAAGAMVITDAVVDVQRYTANWTGFGTPEGWVRVVDSSHAQAGAATARLENTDPSSCQGVLQGELTELALKAA